jgi:HEAT repeat protein
VQRLLEVFQDRRQPVALRTSVVEAIVNSRLTPHRAIIERAFLAEFPTADRRLQHKIAYTLLPYGCDSPEAAVVIQKAIKSIERVLTSGEYADLTVSELLDYVREPRSDFEDNYAAASLQFCARDALGAEPALVPALIVMIKDKSRPHRVAAISVLANMGQAARPAAPALLDLLREEGPDPGRISAIGALRNIFLDPNLDTKDPTPLPAFIEALNDQNDSVRGYAAFVVGRYGRIAAPAIPSLTRIAADEKQEPPTREAAKTALIEIGPVSF